MHCSRMHTVRCIGRLSPHTTHTPLPCMPHCHALRTVISIRADDWTAELAIIASNVKRILVMQPCYYIIDPFDLCNVRVGKYFM